MNHQNYQECLLSQFHFGSKLEFPVLCCSDLQRWARSSPGSSCWALHTNFLLLLLLLHSESLDWDGSRGLEGNKGWRAAPASRNIPGLPVSGRFGRNRRWRFSISQAESRWKQIPLDCWVTPALEPGADAIVPLSPEDLRVITATPLVSIAPWRALHSPDLTQRAPSTSCFPNPSREE